MAELYTTKKVTNLEELVAAPGPKRMVLVMTREIEAGPLANCSHAGWKTTTPRPSCPSWCPVS